MPKLIIIEFTVKGTLSRYPDSKNIIMVTTEIDKIYSHYKDTSPGDCDIWISEISEPIRYPAWFGQAPLVFNAPEKIAD